MESNGSIAIVKFVDHSLCTWIVFSFLEQYSNGMSAAVLVILTLNLSRVAGELIFFCRGA